MTRIALLAAAGLAVFATPAFAQDPTEVDAAHYAVEFENDQIRVVRITYGPGEASVMHWHPDAYAVMLSDGSMMMHTHGEEGEEAMTWEAGQSLWTPATMHAPESLSDGPVEVLLIEMKDGDWDHDADEDHDDDDDYDEDDDDDYDEDDDD